MKKRIHQAIVFFMFSMLPMGLSFAQTENEENMTKAQELVAVARTSLREGKLKQAISFYQKAYEYVPIADYLFAIASIHSRIEGNCSQTIEAWGVFLKNCKDCTQKAKGNKQAKFHKKHCQVTINVDSDPSGAEVFFDKELMGKTPISFQTIAGKHQIKWSLDQHHPFESEVILLKGRDLAIKRATLIPFKQKKVQNPVSLSKSSVSNAVSTTNQTLTKKDHSTKMILLSSGGVLTAIGIASIILAYSEVDELNNANSPDEYRQLESSSSYQLKQGLGYTSIGLGLGLVSYSLLRFEF